MTRTFATACGAAVALALLAVTAPSASADPREVVVESSEPTVSCEGRTTDDSVIDFTLRTNAEGEVLESYLQLFESGSGDHLAEGVPLEATFADGKVDAGFELIDPAGDSVGNARLVGTYTVGETVTSKDHIRRNNSQWHSERSYTPYSLTWSGVALGPWQVGSMDCTAWASEGTNSFTVPHRGVAFGTYWTPSPECSTEEIRLLDVSTYEDETLILVDTADAWGWAAVSGDGVQTGAIDWYDSEGEPLGTGSASATWQQLSPAKVTTASPTPSSNLVTHTTAHQLGFDLERVGGRHLGTTCGVGFVEWRQIGGLGE
ncbi:hypothetical protein SAMN05421678_1126 [Actinopolymorpha cephalotaxi]|uniref:Uncharacterized protein n=1 Tax=Actinopolymorpha cephalotaxi TaxID=504797 RepID=A0A1I2X6S2_9ACTN|nr:hypothetical protein [Actinopolymorpha cephalotaxi]NYH86069.1 hypothetical protein [Actinopolymorpha cephalotaxi]SFH08669.1 hypothetical protein SAMN05421678_1126 [Actinopolymorpha cephalotaxi]